MKLTAEALNILVNHGFTQLESEIYTYLLTKGASTGYGVAKGIGKPAANVYKAVESLSQKGAIEQTYSDKKQCVAVPWKQLLKSQRKKFEQDMEVLENSFLNLPEQEADEQVYQMENIEQLKDYTLNLIKGSKHSLLADIEPNAIDFLKETLVDAASRGVEVIVKVYEPVNLEGVEVIVRDNGKAIYQKTPDTQLSICADGGETMIALLNKQADGVVQAFKTKSSLLSLNIYNKLLYEYTD